MNKEDKLSSDFHNKQTNKLVNQTFKKNCHGSLNCEYTVTVDSYTRYISKEKKVGGNSYLTKKKRVSISGKGIRKGNGIWTQ